MQRALVTLIKPARASTQIQKKRRRKPRSPKSKSMSETKMARSSAKITKEPPVKSKEKPKVQLLVRQARARTLIAKKRKRKQS